MSTLAAHPENGSLNIHEATIILLKEKYSEHLVDAE